MGRTSHGHRGFQTASRDGVNTVNNGESRMVFEMVDSMVARLDNLGWPRLAWEARGGGGRASVIEFRAASA